MFDTRINELIMELGLIMCVIPKGMQLSGGEKRRVEIARALSLNPSFILLDEPFAGVDPIAVSEIQAIINKLKDQGIGIIITDHNVQETLAITDRSYIIHEGKILFTGNPQEISKVKLLKNIILVRNSS